MTGPSSLSSRLMEAAATGEILGIRYHGGSQPGAFRKITPLRIEGDGVRARCYESNAVKVFKLDKIELRDAASPSEGDLASSWKPESGVPHFNSLAEVAAACRGDLEQRGLIVAFEEKDGDATLAIYERFKNGKPRRSPKLIFSYERETFDLVLNQRGEFEEQNRRPRDRPWKVAGAAKSGTWRHADGAVRAFLSEMGLIPETGIRPAPGAPPQATGPNYVDTAVPDAKESPAWIDPDEIPGQSGVPIEDWTPRVNGAKADMTPEPGQAAQGAKVLESSLWRWILGSRGKA